MVAARTDSFMALLQKFFGTASRQMTSQQANEMLVKAVKWGFAGRAEYALEAGGSANLTIDRGGRTSDGFDSWWHPNPVPLLWDAVSRNKVHIVASLLKHGARVDDYHFRMTPLMLAAEKGLTPVVRMLLDAGASLDARDERGTAWTRANNKQFGDIIKMISDEPARRKAVIDAHQRSLAEAEEKRKAERKVQVEKAKQDEIQRALRAANPPQETEQVITVMRPLSLKSARKKRGLFG
jgi:hypothetical protein